jgi:hypothetical protein
VDNHPRKEAAAMANPISTIARSARQHVVGLLGLAVLALWVTPLIRPRGIYWGRYHVLDLEVGLVGALVWASSAAVSAAPARRRRLLALRLATFGVVALLTTVVCDLSYVVWTARVRHFWYYGRAFGHASHAADPDLVWRFRPGFAFRGRANPFSHLVDFRTDEQGFRNPPGVRQADVVFLGDSVTMAAEVPDGGTFVRKTAEALGLSAVNLGVFAYGPQQELAVLRRFGLAYRPRVVVWQVTEWNDCDDAERYAKRAHPDRPQTPPWLTVYETYSPVVAWLANVFPRRESSRDPRVVTFRRSDGLVDDRLIWPYPELALKSRLGLDETKRAIAAADALCRERGIALVVLFVPGHTRVLSPFVLARDATQRARYSPPAGEAVIALGPEVAALCRELGCPMIDLLPALCARAKVNNLGLYIKHDSHLGLDGHEVAARELVGCLGSLESVARGGPRRMASGAGSPARR